VTGLRSLLALYDKRSSCTFAADLAKEGFSTEGVAKTKELVDAIIVAAAENLIFLLCLFLFL